MKKSEMFELLLKIQAESEEEFEIVTDLGRRSKKISIQWK